MRGKDVAFVALFAALTAVSAQMSIPIGPVPVTLQVFLVLLSGLVLGARLGFLSQLVYVLMGAVGIPVFANFQGGFGVIYGPTGGYILAFPIAAFMTGCFAERTEGKTGMILGSLFGVVVIYTFGWLRLGLFLGGDFHKALLIGVLPFVPLDIGKAALAALIADRVKKATDLG